MQRRLAFVPAIILVTAAGLALAQEKKTAGQGASEEIQKFFTEMEDSFNRGDAKAVAACWMPKGEFVGPGGERVEGREDIEKGFLATLAAGGSRKLEIHVKAIRLVSQGVALVDAIPEVKPAPASGGDPATTMVLVRREGHWFIESARETIDRTVFQVQHLKDLEWMVGDWASASAAKTDLSVTSNCEWTANRSFLIRRFKIEGQNALLHGGTEIIGWDPRAHAIRSWVFDSNGAFGENVWVQDGKRWLIKYSGTLVDGSEAAATHVMTQVDANTMTLQSKDRTVNGRRQPDVPETTIKRQAVQPAAPEEPNKPALPILPATGTR